MGSAPVITNQQSFTEAMLFASAIASLAEKHHFPAVKGIAELI